MEEGKVKEDGLSKGKRNKDREDDYEKAVVASDRSEGFVKSEAFILVVLWFVALVKGMRV